MAPLHVRDFTPLRNKPLDLCSIGKLFAVLVLVAAKLPIKEKISCEPYFLHNVWDFLAQTAVDPIFNRMDWCQKEVFV